MVVLLSLRPVWATKLNAASLKQTKIRFILGVEVHTPPSRPSTQEAEKGVFTLSLVQSVLHSEFQVSLYGTSRSLPLPKNMLFINTI